MLTLNVTGVLVGLGIGVFLSLVLVGLAGTSARINRANLVGKTILWGQGLTVCLLWPALELPGDVSRGQRSAIRFELGWLVTTTMCVVLLVATWRSRRKPSAVATFLMVGILGVAGTQLLSSIIADDQLPITAFVPMAVLGIGLALFPLTFEDATRTLTQVTAVLCGVSIATMFVSREWAMPVSERRTLPGFYGDLSLGGVLQHPNLLAPVASFGLALALCRANWTRFPLALLFLTTIWLTDSRTQIVTAILVVLIWSVRESLVHFGRRTSLVLFGVLSTCIAVGGLLVALITNWRIDSRNFGLARRPELWAKAIEYWETSKFIGIGSAAFDEQYRDQSGNRGAVGAHNQFLQTLASEGLLGVLPLLMVFCVVVYAVHRAHEAERFTFRLVGVVGLTLFAVETPLQLQLHRAGHVFLYACVFVALVTASTSKTSVEADPLVDRR